MSHACIILIRINRIYNYRLKTFEDDAPNLVVDTSRVCHWKRGMVAVFLLHFHIRIVLLPAHTNFGNKERVIETQDNDSVDWDVVAEACSESYSALGRGSSLCAERWGQEGLIEGEMLSRAKGCYELTTRKKKTVLNHVWKSIRGFMSWEEGLITTGISKLWWFSFPS